MPGEWVGAGVANFELKGGLSGEDAGEKSVKGDSEGGSCYTKVKGGTNVEFASLKELEGIFTEGRCVFGFASGAVSGKESVVTCLCGFQGAAGFLWGVNN